jgi:transcriptional regulator with XRE-family HTH domain
MTGPELRKARERLGLTQAEMAPLLGVTANSLARLERDERTVTRTMELLVGYVVAAARKKGKAK